MFVFIFTKKTAYVCVHYIPVFYLDQKILRKQKLQRKNNILLTGQLPASLCMLCLARVFSSLLHLCHDVHPFANLVEHGSVVVAN